MKYEMGQNPTHTDRKPKFRNDLQFTPEHFRESRLTPKFSGVRPPQPLTVLLSWR